MNPLIGITTYDRDEKPVINEAFDTHFASPALYTDAVRRAGGVPVLLPTGETDPAAWLSKLDGIILTGGADLNPSLYGGSETHPALGPIHDTRDQSELDLTQAILDHGTLPALFICRGIQVLNIAMGGTLHEDLDDTGTGHLHKSDETYWVHQPVTITADSQLGRILNKPTITTMSGHHQGIKTVGRGLTVAASAEDGITEAVEVEGHPFALGVQWHPEASAATDPDQQAIFDAFVAAARGSRTIG